MVQRRWQADRVRNLVQYWILQKQAAGFSYGVSKGAAAGNEAEFQLRQRVMALETKASLQAADAIKATRHRETKHAVRKLVAAHASWLVMWRRNLVSQWRCNAQGALPWQQILTEMAVPGAPLAAFEPERLAKLVAEERAR